MEKKEKVLFIINPISGLGRQFKLNSLISNYLDLKRFDFDEVFTEYAGHATDICREAVRKGEYDIIVAVGGDGTANEVSRELVGSDVIMGLIPTGSGNGLSRFLGIPFNFRSAFEIINKRKTMKIDTGYVNDKMFINVAGIGFDAEVAKQFVNVQRRGFWPYLDIILKTFPIYKAQTYVIEVDGKTYTRKAFFISFANSSQFGFNATIAPQAKIDDGLLDVCVCRKPNIIEAPFLAQSLFMRTIDKTPYMRTFKISEIKITQPEDEYVHLDGDPVCVGHELVIRVNPLSLIVLIP
ncbi:MAG: diacylglycerol kinase family lipid kinase [Bacteroidales bacterium]|nr:diacylglycerol kinase family lipid kinase [Bacteroidales bacterium]